MPRRYKRFCNQCGIYYERLGAKYFCSAKCMGISFRGHPVFGGEATRFKNGHAQSNSGKTHFKVGNVMTKEHIDKIRVATIRNGRYPPHYSGEENFNWKGGISLTNEYKSFYKNQYKHRKRNAVGFHDFKQWINLKIKYNDECLCCKRREPEIELTEDHILPISKGGSNNIENIQPLCRSCNGKKRDKYINFTIKYEQNSTNR